METNPTPTHPLVDGNTDNGDLAGKASSEPVDSGAVPDSEKYGLNEAAPDLRNGTLKRPREASSDSSDSDSDRPGRGWRSSLSCDDKTDDLRRCIVKPKKIATTFADVHIHHSTIEALQNVTLAMQHPAAFSYGILSKCVAPSVLLYGPPGTGKTLLVRALAKQASSKILAVSGADINSKYVGVGEKKIGNMFALARQEYPCIIFIDEADAMFRSRSAGSHHAHDHCLNEFLVAMDGINSRGPKDPIVVAATNRPFDMDEGILRRLGRRIMVDLPDTAAREEILKIHLRGESLAADVNLPELARKTPDYSGADLKNLVYSAAVTALREEIRSRDKSSPPASGAPDSTESQIGSHRVLRREHFLHAKRETPAAPISDTAAKIREFHNKFGDTVQRRSEEGPINKVK